MARILILDDDDELRVLLRTALVAEGHAVSEAATVRDAEQIASGVGVDVAIVEAALPDGDGISFMDWLKRRGDTSQCIFVSSVWRDPVTATRLAAIGVSEVLPKPVSPAELVWRVGRVLNVQPARVTENPPGLAGRGDELSALRDRYAQTLPAELSALESAVNLARGAGPESPSFTQARALATRLHGTAGTYGFLN